MIISIFLSRDVKQFAFKVGLFSTFAISNLACNALLIANDGIYISFNVFSNIYSI